MFPKRKRRMQYGRQLASRYSDDRSLTSNATGRFEIVDKYGRDRHGLGDSYFFPSKTLTPCFHGIENLPLNYLDLGINSAPQHEAKTQGYHHLRTEFHLLGSRLLEI